MDIAQLILQAGLASQEQLLQAIELQKESGNSLTYIICKLRFAEEEEVAARLAAACGLNADCLETFLPQKELIAKFPQDFLERNQLLPLSRDKGALRVGSPEPCAEELLDELRLIAGEKIEIVLVPAIRTAAVLEEYFGPDKTADDAKIKLPHRHLDGRAALTELVQELSVETKPVKPVSDAAVAEALYGYETRELVFGLIRVLEEQGMLQKEELLRAVRELGGE